MKKFFISILFLFFSNSIFAQSSYSDFLEIKKLFNQNKYPELLSQELSFKKSDEFYPYIIFYRAVSYHKINDKNNSLRLLKNLINDFPNWSQIDEVFYWAVRIELEFNNINNALEYFSKIKEKSINESLHIFFDSKIKKINSFSVLKEWNEVYPSNLVVAKYYGRKLLKEYLDEETLKEIKTLLEFVPKNELFQSEKKTFNIAILLPFMYSSIENNYFIRNNSFILDLYAGINYAFKNFEGNKTNIIINSFDTKRDPDVVREIINSGDLSDIDLIIGPLYGKPIEIIKQFCLENKVLMINPLSNNSLIIQDNNYSLLFQPSLETIAKKAASYASSKFENKNAIIFYENNYQDSLLASTYINHLEEDSFNIIYSKSVSLEDSRLILDSLSSTFEEILNDSVYDTLINVSDIIIKDGRGIENLDTMYKYVDRFYIGNDSIGHVFVSSKNSLFASNVISAVDIREDTIPVIGFDAWLDYNLISVDQFENLNISMISPSFHISEDIVYDQMKSYFINNTGRNISQNFIYGVELMNMIMRINDNYNNFFQFGIRNEKIIPGVIGSGSFYENFNDNQVVPIIRVINSEITLDN